jgi:hypothetical protein
MQSIILGSWFGLGFWKGWAYCAITDWQSKVRQKMGRPPVCGSYVQELVEAITRRKVSASAVNITSLVVFFGTTVASVALYAAPSFAAGG